MLISTGRVCAVNPRFLPVLSRSQVQDRGSRCASCSDAVRVLLRANDSAPSGGELMVDVQNPHNAANGFGGVDRRGGPTF